MYNKKKIADTLRALGDLIEEGKLIPVDTRLDVEMEQEMYPVGLSTGYVREFAGPKSVTWRLDLTMRQVGEIRFQAPDFHEEPSGDKELKSGSPELSRPDSPDQS